MASELKVLGNWKIFYDRPDISLDQSDLGIVYQDILKFPPLIADKLAASELLGLVNRNRAIIPGNEYAYIYLGNLLLALENEQLLDQLNPSPSSSDISWTAFVDTLTDVLVSQAKLRYTINAESLPIPPKHNFNPEVEASFFNTGFLWLEVRLKLHALGLLMWDNVSQQFYGYAEFDQLYARVYEAQRKLELDETTHIAEVMESFGTDDPATTTENMQQHVHQLTEDFMSQLEDFVTRWQEQLAQERENLTSQEIAEVAELAFQVLAAVGDFSEEEQSIISRMVNNAAHFHIDLTAPLNLLQKIHLASLPVFLRLRKRAGREDSAAA